MKFRPVNPRNAFLYGRQEWDLKAPQDVCLFMVKVSLCVHHHLNRKTVIEPVLLSSMSYFPVQGRLSGTRTTMSFGPPGSGVQNKKCLRVLRAFQSVLHLLSPLSCARPCATRLHVSSIIEAACWLCVCVLVVVFPLGDVCVRTSDRLFFVCAPGKSSITGCLWTWDTAAAFFSVSGYKREFRPGRHSCK